MEESKNIRPESTSSTLTKATRFIIDKIQNKPVADILRSLVQEHHEIDYNFLRKIMVREVNPHQLATCFFFSFDF